ncbi:MAG: DUF3592 domain-containing protein [Leptospiraceae bacterium]|nr:DUF3592 domain-containing protein [Leptospiraceae bacterium]
MSTRMWRKPEAFWQIRLPLDNVTEYDPFEGVVKLKTIGKNFAQGGAILLLGSAFFLYRSVFTINDGLASKNWPSTEGTIIEARLEQVRNTGGTTSEKTIAHFFYEYSVNGEQYSSSRLNFFSISGDPVTAAKSHEPGQAVVVYFDPENPDKSVLEPGLPGIFVWLAFGFGLLLFVGFISLTFFGDFGALFSKMAGG